MPMAGTNGGGTSEGPLGTNDGMVPTRDLNEALHFATDYRLSALGSCYHQSFSDRGSDTLPAGTKTRRAAWSARLALSTRVFALRPALAFKGLDHFAVRGPSFLLACLWMISGRSAEVCALSDEDYDLAK